MVNSEIKEIKEIKMIEVNPGETVDLIRRKGNEHLVLITVQGAGVIGLPDRELGDILRYNTAVRLDFRNGEEFVITVREEYEEPLRVIMLRLELTANLS